MDFQMFHRVRDPRVADLLQILHCNDISARLARAPLGEFERCLHGKASFEVDLNFRGTS
jgi:hypothetical protein